MIFSWFLWLLNKNTKHSNRKRFLIFVPLGLQLEFCVSFLRHNASVAWTISTSKQLMWLAQFCHIFAKIYSESYLCIHYTNLWATKIHWTLGLWWDIFYEIGHFYSILKLVKMQKVWNITMTLFMIELFHVVQTTCVLLTVTVINKFCMINLS